MPDLSAQMDAVCHRFEELSVRLNQPDAAADPALFRKLMRDYHETQPVVQAYRDWQTARDHQRRQSSRLAQPTHNITFIRAKTAIQFLPHFKLKFRRRHSHINNNMRL